MIVWREKALTLAEHGGSGGVRDLGLLESAPAHPQPMHAYGLARNHPFVDGMMRTVAEESRQVLPALSRSQIQALLRGLRREGAITQRRAHEGRPLVPVSRPRGISTANPDL